MLRHAIAVRACEQTLNAASERASNGHNDLYVDVALVLAPVTDGVLAHRPIAEFLGELGLVLLQHDEAVLDALADSVEVAHQAFPFTSSMTLLVAAVVVTSFGARSTSSISSEVW